MGPKPLGLTGPIPQGEPLYRLANQPLGKGQHHVKCGRSWWRLSHQTARIWIPHVWLMVVWGYTTDYDGLISELLETTMHSSVSNWSVIHLEVATGRWMDRSHTQCLMTHACTCLERERDGKKIAIYTIYLDTNKCKYRNIHIYILYLCGYRYGYELIRGSGWVKTFICLVNINIRSF